MPKCSNCGRETLRTEDWACQWCGYPLLSRAYKTIPKTYEQLKEERLHKPEPIAGPEPEPEAESVLEPGTETVLESEEEPIAGPEPEPEAESVLEPGTETVLESEEEPIAGPEPEPEAVAIELTFDELLSAYAMDETAADERFVNKILKVTGIIDRIAVNDYLEFYYINLTSVENNQFEHIRCFFDKKYGPELNQLITGQKVTVQGRYEGSIMVMRLKGCVLVS